ncbi:MAG TPA: zf-HC2 domain-containing protein [Thermoanaerobaculia bacterium]|nr:zf-HC2 domain-containing protein [Thermoanaerobaculia bacterium]
MPRWDESLRCEEALALLEPLIDGELSAAEEARLRAHLERCPACAAEWKLAADIRSELRALPELDCPPAVLERVFREAAHSSVVPLARPRRTNDGAGSSRRPFWAALAAAVLVALLAAGLLVQQLSRPRPPSAAEVERATAEARFALAYVGEVSRRAGLDLRDDVLRKHLVLPAARGLSQSLQQSLGPEAQAPAVPGAVPGKGRS